MGGRLSIAKRRPTRVATHSPMAQPSSPSSCFRFLVVDRRWYSPTLIPNAASRHNHHIPRIMRLDRSSHRLDRRARADIILTSFDTSLAEPPIRVA